MGADSPVGDPAQEGRLKVGWSGGGAASAAAELGKDEKGYRDGQSVLGIKGCVVVGRKTQPLL